MNINDEDVVSVEKTYSFAKTTTSKMSEMKSALEDQLDYWAGDLREWFDEGIECEYLQPQGGGWKRGKLKVKFEFEFEPDGLETSEHEEFDDEFPSIS